MQKVFKFPFAVVSLADKQTLDSNYSTKWGEKSERKKGNEFLI